MQIHVKGVSRDDREAMRQMILGWLHQHGIHYEYWSWDWEDPVQVTDDSGKLVAEGVNIELPGTEAIRREASKGLLDDISRELSGVVVYVVLAPVEASFEGKRL